MLRNARIGWFVFAAAALVALGPRSLVADEVVIQRDVVYGHAGERALHLDIVRPKQPGEEPLPVICFIHGGGWRGGNKSGPIGFLRSFAASGQYFCVSIEYRLSGEAKWPAQIHDCKAAVRWLKANAKKYNLDPGKIGVWGMSAGGHLVSLLGTSGGVDELEGNCGSPDQSSRVACVLDFFGPTDLRAMAADPKTLPMVVTMIEQLLGGPVKQKAEQAKAASPVTYVSKDDPPFLIMHGSEDKLVPIEQAELLHEALKKAGVDSTFVRVEGAGHGFVGPQINRRVSAFFARHLKGQLVEVSSEPIRPGRPKPSPQPQ